MNQGQDPLTHQIIGCAIEVHKELGPGLLESIYQEALAIEFQLQGIQFHKELELPVSYKGYPLGAQYRLDFMVSNEIIIELKAVEATLPIHHAQLLTYMKLTNKPKGLLINFNVPVLSKGIKRFAL
ncbi:MAG: GxxExxY protein [Thiotrichales bacterium]|nr:GxxExxY protein [Thiotrichales bacterium]